MHPRAPSLDALHGPGPASRPLRDLSFSIHLASGGALFLVAKMSQNVVYDFLVLDTRDDSDRSTAVAADFNIYVEYSLESLSSGHTRYNVP